MANERTVAKEIRDEYVDTMSKIYYSYFKSYSGRLLKVQVSGWMNVHSGGMRKIMVLYITCQSESLDLEGLHLLELHTVRMNGF